VAGRLNELIETLRPLIARDDWDMLTAVEILTDACVRAGASRDDIARALVDNFRGSILAERAAYRVLFPDLH